MEGGEKAEQKKQNAGYQMRLFGNPSPGNHVAPSGELVREGSKLEKGVSGDNSFSNPDLEIQESHYMNFEDGEPTGVGHEDEGHEKADEILKEKAYMEQAENHYREEQSKDNPERECRPEDLVRRAKFYADRGEDQANIHIYHEIGNYQEGRGFPVDAWYSFGMKDAHEKMVYDNHSELKEIPENMRQNIETLLGSDSYNVSREGKRVKISKDD